MNLKILLLQARHEDDPARAEERASFATRAGLELEQFIPHDLLQGPPTLEQVRRYDALMVGGSGDYTVSKWNLPQQAALLELLTEVVALGHPTFASCFGFHLLVEALGGEIIHDPERLEVGTYPLTLTAEGRRDELFRILPLTFCAQLGHKDRALHLPPGAANLAASELAPQQAFRLSGKPIWATQFHPELSGMDNRLRFERYARVYADVYTPSELQTVRDRFAESAEAERLIPRFLKLVFG